MAREITQQSYFDHSLHVNTYYASMIPVEHFLSQILVKGDISRVIFASDDMAFRRRLSLADAQNGFNIKTAEPSSLNFPFVNYWYNGAWDPDDRTAAVQPMQMIQGHWAPGLPTYLRATAVKGSFNATAFYGRDDDARLAYEMLLWEYLPQGPILFSTEVEWENTKILIPVVITLEKPEYAPNVNESEWLTKQRIFPIKIPMTIRSYSLQSKPQTNVEGALPRLVNSFNTGSGALQDSERMYLTEEVILNFASGKNWGELSTAPIEFVEDEFTEEEQETGIADVKDITVDLVRGYFEQSPEVEVNACYVDPDSIENDSFDLRWVVKTADLPKLASIKILVPGREPIGITDKTLSKYKIEGLHQNSDYSIKVMFYSVSGNITTEHITVQTTANPDDPVQRPLVKRRGKLQGMSW